LGGSAWLGGALPHAVATQIAKSANQQAAHSPAVREPLIRSRDDGAMSERSEADEAISYSSRGNTRWIILKGSRGRAFDRALVRYTGFSFITWQYAKAAGVGYRSTLLLTTIGKRSGSLRSRALPYHRDDDRFVVVGSNG